MFDEDGYKYQRTSQNEFGSESMTSGILEVFTE